MSTPKTLIAIGLGSNLGDREGQLRTAVSGLAAVVSEIKVGGLYESEALGSSSEPRYLNSALVGRTSLSPEPLLAVMKFLEQRAGRRRGPRWSARPLDLDLLLHGTTVSAAPALRLPHCELARRPFVLAPLADVAPRLEVPPEGRTVAELLERLGCAGLERLDWSAPPPGAGEHGAGPCYPSPRPSPPEPAA